MGGRLDDRHVVLLKEVRETLMGGGDAREVQHAQGQEGVVAEGRAGRRALSHHGEHLAHARSCSLPVLAGVVDVEAWRRRRGGGRLATRWALRGVALDFGG